MTRSDSTVLWVSWTPFLTDREEVSKEQQKGEDGKTEKDVNVKVDRFTERHVVRLLLNRGMPKGQVNNSPVSAAGH